VKQRISPTRMKLLETKKRYLVAVKGHKLLKEKLEALVHELVKLAREFEKQEILVGNRLPKILEQFIMIRSNITDDAMEKILKQCTIEYHMQMSEKNIMNLSLPVFQIIRDSFHGIHYENFGITPGFDFVLHEFDAILSDLLKLAELEFSLFELAKIVETTKRRVNALEYILIPELETTIKTISSKLDENERSNIVRLMKIKDILSKKN
jgi:V/A-type H+-transporting ATPase subunit D